MGLLIIIVGVLVVIFTLIYLWAQRKYRFWNDHGIMQMEPIEFPYGNIKGTGTKIHFSQFWKKVYFKYKNLAPVVGTYFFFKPIFLITDLDVAKDVLIKNFNNFHGRGMYYNTKSDPLSGHLFSLDGSEWKSMRTKLTPTFTSGKIKMMFNIVLEVSHEMVKYLKIESTKNCDLELKDILARFTTDVIGNVAFGLELNSMKDPNSKFREIGLNFFNFGTLRMIKMFFINIFPDFSKRWDFKVTEQETEDFFMKSIKETIEHREKNNVHRNDFLDLMIQLKNHGKLYGESQEFDKITFNELVAQCFVFFLAGFETSSTAMIYCLYELAQNSEIQDKLRTEITQTLKENDEKLTYDSMKSMKYLHMVIEETLRKFPPLDALMRVNEKEYKLPNHDLILPNKCMVFIPIYNIQHDPEYYPEPEKFDPERFNEENKKNRNPMTFLPFGDGPKNCIGSRFGYMQTKIGIIQLLSHFKFSVCSKTTIPMQFKPFTQVLTPINDMWLKVEKL